MPFSIQQQASGHGTNRERILSHDKTLFQDLNSCTCTVEEKLLRCTSVTKQPPLKKILVKLNKRLIIVDTQDIDWVEAWGDYIRLHCKGKTYMLHQRISDVEARLDPQQFLRIGRSAIVNIDRIKELEPLNHGDYIISLYDDTQLNLSRNYRDCLNALFDGCF